jgi:CDP-paratose 2-epimerase
MKLLITGLCGFAGSSLAFELQRRIDGVEIWGVDNLSRPGSELNRGTFRSRGIRCLHGDVRNPSDLEGLPRPDWIIDAAANPSVLAGAVGGVSSRQLMEHNLIGTLNLLEHAKRHSAGLVLLSTSRVYSQSRLAALPIEARDGAFAPKFGSVSEPGLSSRGVAEDFSTQPPLSLYGSAKLGSEILALEYGAAFNLPVFINRCGVLAGPGQFGKADQGIFSFWIHSFREKRPLKYIGFGGSGRQVRDCLHPRDLADLLTRQLRQPDKAGRVLNVGGGAGSSMSLAQLTAWCAQRFGPREVQCETSNRLYDVPWLVLDAARAEAEFGWRPETRLETVLEEIAAHAGAHPEWLDLARDP